MLKYLILLKLIIFLQELKLHFINLYFKVLIYTFDQSVLLIIIAITFISQEIMYLYILNQIFLIILL